MCNYIRNQKVFDSYKMNVINLNRVNETVNLVLNNSNECTVTITV